MFCLYGFLGVHAIITSKHLHNCASRQTHTSQTGTFIGGPILEIEESRPHFGTINNSYPHNNFSFETIPPGLDQVLISFQLTILEMTNSFLMTQQQVMLTYLAMRANDEIRDWVFPSKPSFPSPPTRARSTNTKLRESASIQKASELLMPTEAPIRKNQEQTTSTIVRSEAGEKNTTLRQEQKLAIAAAELNSEALISSFIQLVSERTGYPTEMLDPTLDLESDLGIDSIKRVEIFSNFRRLLPDTVQTTFEENFEELSGLRTLESIENWILNISQNQKN